MNRNYKLVVFLGMFIAAAIISSTIVHAQQVQEADAVEEMKSIQGEVVSLYPKNEPNQIGIAHAESNADYFFKIAEDVKVVHKKGLDEIVVGDIVELIFKQKSHKDSGDMIERQVTTIKFIKPAKKADELISE